MKYIGLQSQIWRNNLKSTLLLLGFPTLILALVLVFFLIVYPYPEFEKSFQTQNPGTEKSKNELQTLYYKSIKTDYFQVVPWVTLGVGVWFLIAYFTHLALIKRATGSKSLERKENKRVYNLVENLAISQGMQPPKINIIEDSSLNAFASGINQKTYTITLSRGIIDKLNDQELEAVIAHELTHIQNRDVRLLIISIVFVGIFAFISEMAFRSLRYSGGGSGRNKKSAGGVIIVILVLALVGYFISIIFRFALSRKREYLADAGSAMMTHHPENLAVALEKISHDSAIEAVKRKDVAQLFIENPSVKFKQGFSFFSRVFATHPPIEDRIEVLKQY